jgi:RHS repeat-associated protein
MSRTVCKALILFFLTQSIALRCAVAQDQDYGNQDNIGFPENGAFDGDSFASAQLNNHNLHIEIPLWTMPGRGVSVTEKFVYDNKGWYFKTTCDHMGICHDVVQAPRRIGLSLITPFSDDYVSSKNVYQECTPGIKQLTLTSRMVHESDGTRHHQLPDPAISGGNTCWGDSGSTPYSDDGSGFVNGQRKDGTTLASDTNGNYLTEWVDTLGRTIPTDGSYYDSSGTLRAVSVTNTTITTNTALCIYSNADVCSESTLTHSVPQLITLPNGLSYTISYTPAGSSTTNPYGEPASITLPTGGQVSFTWSDPPDVAGRDIASRTFTANGNSYTWSYALGILDPAGNLTAFGCAYLKPGYRDWSDGAQATNPPCYINQVNYYQGTSTLLKTVQTDYDTTGAVLPIRETTTWVPQNLVTKTETDYDTLAIWSGNFTWKNPMEKREYAYGTGAPGGLVRRTDFNYLHLTNSTYRNLNIADRPTSKIVYDGLNNIKAQTTYTYDGGTLASTSGTPAPNHDYTNFGSTYTTRGNLTQTSEGLLVGSTWTWLNTTHTYDDLGNRLSTKDPNLNQTSFSYIDTWADSNCTLGANTSAYLTSTTDPLLHQTQHSYFRCMGLLASTKDQNDINNSGPGTTVTYDLMNRPYIVSHPDGGQTTNTYSVTLPLTATQVKLVTTSLNIQHTTVFDDLGRVKQTQFNDPDCTAGSKLVKVDHAYGFTTGVGEFTQVSTPYCDTPNSVYGLMATTQHDALDRITSVTQTDGSTVTTTYSGTTAGLTATVTDEAGKARTSLTDALGHLTKVWEDPSVLNYETDYAYDTLDSLTGVTQQGGASSGSWRNRSFTYDSLGRLKCAANPEVTSSVNTPASCPATDTGTYTPGTIGYTYDADGNVLTKTAPAPNQTGTASTAVTTFSYDALNRLTQKRYTGGATTPTVQFSYDGNALGGCTTNPPSLSPADANSIYYRTAMCDGSGATAWSHDPMGRVLNEHRLINGTSLINKNIFYAYYKDGELNTLTYPSTRVITYTANGTAGFSAGRPVSAVDTANSINYVTSAAYAPQGALASLTNGASILGSFSYNSRMQPLQMYYGTNSPPSLTGSTCPGTVGNILHRVYNFNVGTNDNGNVLAITNCRDTNRTQNIAYDALNRITTAATQGTTCASCWGQRFGHLSGSTFVPGIDPWGNLHEITLTQGTAGTLTQSMTLNNQFVGMTYDASGNLINDGGGHTYTFDDENRLTATAGYTYLYDADGMRVKKCSNSGCTAGTVYWTGTGSDPISEAGVAGSVTEEYILFDGERVARRDASNGNVHYYFSDHLKSADVITSNIGVIQEESDYVPYGGEVVVTGSDINNYKFTGKERDAESGLDYFDARHYANAWGRFMQPDWAAKPTDVPYANFGNPQSLNLYSYVQNNPTTMGDPDGHFAGVDDALEALAVTAVVAVTAVEIYNLQPQNQRNFGQATSQALDRTVDTVKGWLSHSSTEQGRDKQGKFLPKQPGQTQPGAAGEKEGLESEGATKNTKPLPGSKTIPDGTRADGTKVEVKSGGTVNNTGQLRDMGQATVNATGKPLTVVTTNPNVTVSKPAANNPNLVIKPLKKPPSK